MSDIAGLESRLAAALERIRLGVESFDKSESTSNQSDQVAALTLKLEEEQTANAQLAERVKALGDRQAGLVSPLEDKVSSQAEEIASLDVELQRLRATNADLSELSAQLRSAASDGIADAELINRALAAELDALNAQRSADKAELAALLSELKPIVEGA